MSAENRKNALAFAVLMIVAIVTLAIEQLRATRLAMFAKICLSLVILGLVALIFALTIHFAQARDLGQWDGTDLTIRQWYQTLMQPDNPAVSCCGEADAYWADSFEVDGDKYVAIITDTRPDEPLRRKHIDVGTRIVVPNHKLKFDQSNPTGHGIIFLSRGDYVYCYVAPGGV